MRARAFWVLSFLWIGAVPSGAQQYTSDACLEAARTLVRQQARWYEGGRTMRSQSRELRYWQASDGTWGSCRFDPSGRVYEVRIEEWGRGGGWQGGPGPGHGSGELTTEYGYDRRGDDYTSIAARTLAQCQMACREDRRCVAYTFGAREGRCWLKSRVNPQQASRDMVTGFKTTEWDDENDWDDEDDWSLTEEWHYDRRGNDYTTFRTQRLVECQDACSRDGRCRAYTFDTRNGVCYLKDRANSPQANRGMVTGFKE